MAQRRPVARMVYLTGRAFPCFLWLLVGCSSSNGLLFQTQRHPMLASTKALRQTTPAPLPRELAKKVHDRYVVESGDTLLLSVTDPRLDRALPGDQPVLLDGTIPGQFGHVVAAGKTVDEIEATIRRSSRPRRRKPSSSESASLAETRVRSYYVIGEVNAPGVSTGRETVLDGIVAAEKRPTRHCKMSSCHGRLSRRLPGCDSHLP